MAELEMNYIIRNKRPQPMWVILEPWADEILVPPGSVLAIDIFAEKPGLLETEVTPEFYIVWCWSGCRTIVSLDGNKLFLSGDNIRVP
jgi:hypothetical protein